MALTLTVGTNTYISLTDAETYMEKRYDPSGAWASAVDATKNQLLANATMLIDRQVWLGSKTSSTQTLEFPRDGDTSIETKVTYACVEQALWLLTSKGTRAELQAQGVRSVTVGGVSEQWNGGGQPSLCPEARRLLIEWLPLGAVIV